MKRIALIIIAGFALIVFSKAEALSYPTTLTCLGGSGSRTTDCGFSSSGRISYNAPRLSYAPVQNRVTNAPAYSLAQTASVANAFQNSNTNTVAVTELPRTGGGGKAKTKVIKR